MGINITKTNKIQRKLTDRRKSTMQITNTPIKPNTKQCEFCGLNTPKANLTKVTSLMRQFNICPKCYNKFKNHRCIICGNLTEDKVSSQVLEWKGLCEKCTQIVMSGTTKLRFEQEQGVDFDSTMEVIPNREQEITNEELSDLLNYGKKFMQSLNKD